METSLKDLAVKDAAIYVAASSSKTELQAVLQEAFLLKGLQRAVNPGSDENGHILKDGESRNSQSTGLGTKLNDSVYEFYRPDGEFSVEIVAFHGLRFSDYRDAYETTWELKNLENRSGSWLRDFLPRSFPGARILSVSYDSCAKVSDQAGRMSFSNLGMILVQDIIHLAKVGQQGCPVLLVGYCLGGLVIKQLCTEAEKQYDQAPDGSSKGRLEQFLTNVRGIVFIDTPEAGSALGEYLRKAVNCYGPVLEYLKESSRDLGKLTTEFESLVFEREWERACFWYLTPTKVWDSLRLPESGLEVVREESVRLGNKGVRYVVGEHSVRALGSEGVLHALTDVLFTFFEETNGGNRRKEEGRRRKEEEEEEEEGRRKEGNVRRRKEPSHPHGELNRSPTTTVNEYRPEDIKRVDESLYQMYRPVAEQDAKLELIFFPGFLQEESCNATWMAEDNKHCWLQTWLPNAFPEARIFAVSYDLSRSDVYLLCENLIHQIIRNRRKRRSLPLILVGHCLGGLVIKYLCRQVEAIDVDDRRTGLQEFLRSIRGIAYYGTSHVGYCSCYEQAGMSEGDNKIHSSFSAAEVSRLNAQHLYNVRNFGWKELALGETQPTKQRSRKIVIVDEFSASRGIQRNSFFPVAADHFSMCKPKSPYSNSFQYLEHFIHTTMKEAQYRNMNVRRKKWRGIFVTIGMQKERPGSDSDLRRLESTADYLNFELWMVLNRDASELPSIIGEILKKVNKEDECILCCVSAHGAVSAKSGIHYIFDNKKERIQLSAILKPIAVYTLLEGKPKVFVVNSCRGETDEIDDTPGLWPEQNVLHGIDDSLLMYSTQLYTPSFRRETGYEQGTLLISELAYQISLLYQTTDVQDIFEKVKKMVPELAKKDEVEQFPEMYSSLRKRLSWRPRCSGPSTCNVTQEGL